MYMVITFKTIHIYKPKLLQGRKTGLSVKLLLPNSQKVAHDEMCICLSTSLVVIYFSTTRKLRKNE